MEVQNPVPTNCVSQNSSTSSAITSCSEVSSVSTAINLENLDKQCSALAGLFQQTVNDMKVLPQESNDEWWYKRRTADFDRS